MSSVPDIEMNQYEDEVAESYIKLSENVQEYITQQKPTKYIQELCSESSENSSGTLTPKKLSNDVQEQDCNLSNIVGEHLPNQNPTKYEQKETLTGKKGYKSFGDVAMMVINEARLKMEASRNYQVETIVDGWCPEYEFKKKECVYYSYSISYSRCECGFHKKEHNTQLCEDYEEISERRWSPSLHIKEFTTDAFGEINFSNGNKAKYIRVSSSTNEENLLKFMISSWKMQNPKLLLSVIGSAKEHSFQPKLRIFGKNLQNAFSSTGTWIITGGTNAGVMKYVGKAVSYYNLKDDMKKPIVSIGIATWGSISNRKALVNIKGCSSVNYNSIKGQVDTSLDMNHSHFILVDSGIYKEDKIDQSTINLRNRLEKQIMLKRDKITGTRIPNVTILVEGTPDVLTSVLETLKNESPVIVIGGSGQVSDLLEFAYNNSEPLSVELHDSIQDKKYKKTCSFYNAKFEDELLEKIKDVFPIYISKDTLKDQVLNCIEYRDFITIFYIDNIEDISLVILKALIKAKKISRFAQMMLAMDWDRADTAKNELFPHNLKDNEIEDLIFKAIIENKTSFVSLFLLPNFNLSHFLFPNKNENNKLDLKENRLIKLFEFNDFKVRFGLDKNTAIQSISDINNILSKQTGNFERSFIQLNSKLMDPAYFLFIWCVLMGYKEMALLFWCSCKHPIASALVAQYTLNSIYKSQPDKEFSKKLKDDEKVYGKVAEDLLTKCYEFNKEKSIQMLNQNLPEYNNSTIFHMAVKANNKEFVGHSAYQDLLSDKWNDKLDDNNSKTEIFISLMIPFFAPFLINHSKVSYKQDIAKKLGFKVKRKSSLTNDGSEIKSSYFRKIQYFCSIPFATFFYNCISHFALLILFAIILQTDFYPIDGKRHPVISIKEIILIIWMTTILIEEIRQVISNEEKTWLKKIYNYSYSLWNIIDMLGLALFVCGLILRFQPTSSCRLCFYSARIVLTFSLLLFFLRVLHMFSVNKDLGPKLIMMGNMIIDLFYFMLILMVVITSYGLTTQIIMYPNQKIDILLVRNIYSAAWWDIFGALSIDEISGHSCSSNYSLDAAVVCAATYSDTDDWTSCPSRKDQCPANSWVVLIMLGVYVLIVNIMMINILIAIFNHTFENLQKESELIWKMQRYFLVLEYELRPALPPPFVFISHISSIYYFFFKRPVQCTQEENDNSNWLIKMNNWKSEIAKEFYEANLKDTNAPAQESMSRMDLKSKIEHDNLEINRKLDKNEKQLSLLMKSLSLGFENMPSLEEMIKEEKDDIKAMQRKRKKSFQEKWKNGKKQESI